MSLATNTKWSKGRPLKIFTLPVRPRPSHPDLHVTHFLILCAHSFSDQSTIFFDSHTVSKSDSSSQLSVLDPEDQCHVPQVDAKKLDVIVRVLREEMNLTLFGVDVVVENHTGRHAIIDINAYPGSSSE